MAQLLEREHSLIEVAQQLDSMLAATGDAKLHAKRRAALAKFRDVGIPTTKDEEFKYLPLHKLAVTNYAPAYGANIYRKDVPALGDFQAATLAFVNGQHAPELEVIAKLPKGVVFMPIQEALEAHPELLENHLANIASLEGKLGTTNDERFVHLNTAYLSDGAFIFVPKGVTVEVPLQILYISAATHEPTAVFPRTLIVLEENAEVKVVERYLGMAGDYFDCPVTEISVAKSARLEHVRIQEEGATAIHIGNTYVAQEADSVLNSVNISFGAAISRNDLNVFVQGEHCETWMNGVYLGQGEQLIDNHTRLDHMVPNCNSFEVYKGILDDKATGVFNGKIFVYEDAQKTDAKQTNQALLLSPDATINTKPQLEIFADDVKCTHGATVGQTREDAMFYLRARGIPEKQARGLLVYAFAAEVIEKITIPALAEALEKGLFQKLGL